jgi:hypothetical protein
MQRTNRMRKYGRKGKTGEYINFVLTHYTSDCVYWPHGRDGQGYARAFVPGYRTRLAHRIICEIKNGPPPEGVQYARHLCGKGHLGCVNPYHLEWGTPTDNQDDQRRLGLRAYGSDTTNAVLEEDDIPKIRGMKRTGLSYQKIGDAFGVQRSTIQAIIEGRTWKHVP